MTFVRFNHPFRNAFRLLPFYKAVLLSAIYLVRMAQDSIKQLCLTTKNGGHWYALVKDLGVVIDTGDGLWVGYQIPSKEGEIERSLKKIFRLPSFKMEDVPHALSDTMLVSFVDINTNRERTEFRLECGCTEITENKQRVWNRCAGHQQLCEQWPQLRTSELKGDEFGLRADTAYTILQNDRERRLSDTQIVELIRVFVCCPNNELVTYLGFVCITERLEEYCKQGATELPRWAGELTKLPGVFRTIRYLSGTKDILVRLKEKCGKISEFSEFRRDIERACLVPRCYCYIRLWLGYFLLVVGTLTIWWWHVPDWQTLTTLTVTGVLGYLGWRLKKCIYEH